MKFLIVLVAACSCFPYILTEGDAAAAAAAAAEGDGVASAAAAAASGDASRLPTCRCSTYIDPVCGSDNVTYRNLCFLNCQSLINQSKNLPPIHLKNHGACQNEACLCNYNWDPVCGSDGKTYANPCLLRCENRRRQALGLPPITVDYNGQCINCICPAVYDPVCASDGKTYGNSCLLGCENEIRKRKGLPPLSVASKGECVCNCNYCSWIFQPVCGSDRRTYWNVCWLLCNSQCNVNAGRPPITLAKIGNC